MDPRDTGRASVDGWGRLRRGKSCSSLIHAGEGGEATGGLDSEKLKEGKITSWGVGLLWGGGVGREVLSNENREDCGQRKKRTL